METFSHGYLLGFLVLLAIVVIPQVKGNPSHRIADTSQTGIRGWLAVLAVWLYSEPLRSIYEFVHQQGFLKGFRGISVSMYAGTVVLTVAFIVFQIMVAVQVTKARLLRAVVRIPVHCCVRISSVDRSLDRDSYLDRVALELRSGVRGHGSPGDDRAVVDPRCWDWALDVVCD